MTNQPLDLNDYPVVIVRLFEELQSCYDICAGPGKADVSKANWRLSGFVADTVHAMVTGQAEEMRRYRIRIRSALMAFKQAISELEEGF